MSPEKLCIGDARHLLPFVKEAFSLGFEEEPNYDKLKSILSKVLLDHNVAPNLRFDWSKFTLNAMHKQLLK